MCPGESRTCEEGRPVALLARIHVHFTPFIYRLWKAADPTTTFDIYTRLGKEGAATDTEDYSSATCLHYLACCAAPLLDRLGASLLDCLRSAYVVFAHEFDAVWHRGKAIRDSFEAHKERNGKRWHVKSQGKGLR